MEGKDLFIYDKNEISNKDNRYSLLNKISIISENYKKQNGFETLDNENYELC